MATYCGCCHDCGTALVLCLDGEEWCPKCQEYRRYTRHGWPRLSHKGDSKDENSSCPSGHVTANEA